MALKTLPLYLWEKKQIFFWNIDEGRRRQFLVDSGTEQDLTKAVESYTKSTEQGNSVAMDNLGCRHHKGERVDQDTTKAFELFKQSALLGYSMGMYNVGMCYQLGEGVAVDYSKAKEWYAKSAAPSEQDAQAQLDSLNAVQYRQIKY